MSDGTRERDHDALRASYAAGVVPVSPALQGALDENRTPRQSSLVDGRVIFLSAVAVLIGCAAALIARVLTGLIGLVTNLAYYGRFSTQFASPAHSTLSHTVLLFIPAAGGVIVGLMARYGSAAIRGHGIPEAMEQVLLNESRIPPRITFLKPLSAAVAIGSGGPFGAEGPIIATGGALGSFIGQLLRTTAVERKVLLAAGAAAGMTATFGSPVSAVLLAMELLLFEFRPRSLVPVAFASIAATSVRYALVGSAAVFAMPHVSQPAMASMAFYALLGLFMGIASVGVTRVVYAVEDGFEHLPIHWMWWPAIGGLAVGAIGLVSPHTLGVGYDNIERVVNGNLLGRAALLLCILKFVSWCISLGSGTSGGTLAPLFTMGGSLGAVIGGSVAAYLPWARIDVRVAAAVGMAAMFAGASRALLASIVFAFETTLQPAILLPLLAGCTGAYAVSCLLMRHTIMTEKIARRGVRVPSEYTADFLDQVLTRDVALRAVISLNGADTLENVRNWLHSGAPGSHHQGYPVLDDTGRLVGVVTRRDILEPSAAPERDIRSIISRPAAVAFDDTSLREAADHMVEEGVGRLPIVLRAEPGHVVGIITRSDLLAAHGRRLRETQHAVRSIRMRDAIRRRTFLRRSA